MSPLLAKRRVLYVRMTLLLLAAAIIYLSLRVPQDSLLHSSNPAARRTVASRVDLIRFQ